MARTRTPSTPVAANSHAGGRWLTISAGTRTGNDVWLADLSTCSARRPELRVVQEGLAANTAVAVGHDGRVYLLTDHEAPRRHELALLERDSAAIERSRLRKQGKERKRDQEPGSQSHSYSLCCLVPLAAVCEGEARASTQNR